MTDSSPHLKRDEVVRQCCICISTLNGACIKCVECKRKTTFLCVPCFQLGAEAGEHVRGHNYEVIDPIGPSICPVGRDGVKWSLADILALLDFVREYKLGNWEELTKYFTDKAKVAAARNHFDQYFLNGAIWNHVRPTEEPYFDPPSEYPIANSIDPTDDVVQDIGQAFAEESGLDIDKSFGDISAFFNHIACCPLPIGPCKVELPEIPQKFPKKRAKTRKSRKIESDSDEDDSPGGKIDEEKLAEIREVFPESLHFMKQRRPFSDEGGKVKDDDLNALGYMPARDDFEVEYRNRSEYLICGNHLYERAVCETGQEFEYEVKKIRMQRYRREQKEREVAKGMLREFGLVSQFVSSLKTSNELVPKTDREELLQKLSCSFDQGLLDTVKTVVGVFTAQLERVERLQELQRQGTTVLRVPPQTKKRAAAAESIVNRMRELLAHAVVTLGTGRFFVTVGGDEAADVEEEFEEAASTSFLAVESGEFVIATAARSLRLRIRRLRLLKGNRDALCVELGDAPQNRQAGRGPDHSPTTFSRNPPRTNGTASGNSGAQGVHGTPIRRGSMGGTPNASGPGRYGSPSGSSIRSPGFSNQPLNLSTKKPPDDPKEDKKPKQKNSKEEKKPSNSTAAGKSEVKLIPDNPFFSQALLNSMKSTVPKMKKFAQNVAKKPLGLLKAKESANVICVPSVTSPTAIVAAMQKKAKEEEAAKVKEAEKQRKKSDAQKIDELFCQPSTSKSTPPHRKPERKNSTERLRESDKAMAEPVDPKQHLEKTKASPLERESSRDKNKWLSFPDKPTVKKKEEAVEKEEVTTLASPFDVNYKETPRKEEAAAAKETEEREAPESTKVPNGAPGEELIGISPCSSYTSQLDLSPADVSMMEEIRKIERSVDDTVDWNDFNYNISRPSSAINVRSVKYEEVRVPDDDLYRLDSDEEGGEENVEEEEEARKDEGKEDDNNAAGIPVTPVQSPEGEDSRSPASSKNESSLLSPTGSIPTSSEAQKGPVFVSSPLAISTKRTPRHREKLYSGASAVTDSSLDEEAHDSPMEMSSIDSPISISSQGENEEEEHSTFTKTYVREKRPLEEKCDISLLHPEELECEDVTPVTSPEHELSDEDSNTQMDFPSIRGASVEEINNCVYDMLRSSENDPEEAVTKESKEDTEKEEKIEPPRKASKKRRSKSHGPSKRSRRAREGLRHSSSVPNFIHTLTSEWVTPKVARSFDDILFAIGQVVGNAEMPEAQRSLCVYAQHNTPAPVIQQNVIVHQNVSVQQHVTVTDEDGNETTTVTNETSTSTTVTKQTQFIQQPSGDLMKIACREKTEEQQMAVLPAPEAESEKPIVEELEEEFIDDSAVVLTTVSDGPEPQIEEPEAEEPEESFTWEGVGQGGPEIKELEAEEPECEELEEKEPEVLEPEEIMEPPKELEEIQEAKIEDYSETLSPVSVSSEPESEESEDEGKSGEDEESDAMSSESDVLENEEYKHGRGQELAVVFEEFVEEPAIEEEHEKVAGIEERVFYAEKLEEEGLTDAELMGEFPEERKESSEDESKEITEELEEDSESEVEQSDSEVESDEEENWRGNPESDAISVEERQVGTPEQFLHVQEFGLTISEESEFESSEEEQLSEDSEVESPEEDLCEESGSTKGVLEDSKAESPEKYFEGYKVGSPKVDSENSEVGSPEDLEESEVGLPEVLLRVSEIGSSENEETVEESDLEIGSPEVHLEEPLVKSPEEKLSEESEVGSPEAFLASSEVESSEESEKSEEMEVELSEDALAYRIAEEVAKNLVDLVVFEEEKEALRKAEELEDTINPLLDILVSQLNRLERMPGYFEEFKMGLDANHHEELQRIHKFKNILSTDKYEEFRKALKSKQISRIKELEAMEEEEKEDEEEAQIVPKIDEYQEFEEYRRLMEITWIGAFQGIPDIEEFLEMGETDVVAIVGEYEEEISFGRFPWNFARALEAADGPRCEASFGSNFIFNLLEAEGIEGESGSESGEELSIVVSGGSVSGEELSTARSSDTESVEGLSIRSGYSGSGEELSVVGSEGSESEEQLFVDLSEGSEFGEELSTASNTESEEGLPIVQSKDSEYEEQPSIVGSEDSDSGEEVFMFESENSEPDEELSIARSSDTGSDEGLSIRSGDSESGEELSEEQTIALSENSEHDEDLSVVTSEDSESGEEQSIVLSEYSEPDEELCIARSNDMESEEGISIQSGNSESGEELSEEQTIALSENSEHDEELSIARSSDTEPKGDLSVVLNEDNDSEKQLSVVTSEDSEFREEQSESGEELTIVRSSHSESSEEHLAEQRSDVEPYKSRQPIMSDFGSPIVNFPKIDHRKPTTIQPSFESTFCCANFLFTTAVGFSATVVRRCPEGPFGSSLGRIPIDLTEILGKKFDFRILSPIISKSSGKMKRKAKFKELSMPPLKKQKFKELTKMKRKAKKKKLKKVRKKVKKKEVQKKETKEKEVVEWEEAKKPFPLKAEPLKVVFTPPSPPLKRQDFGIFEVKTYRTLAQGPHEIVDYRRAMYSRNRRRHPCPPMLALPAPERHDDLDQAFDEDLTNIVDRIDLRGPTFYNVTYKGEEPYLTRVCKYLFAQLIEDISGEIIENAYKEEKLGAVMTLEDASRRYTEKLLKKAIWITHTALFLALNETWIRELLVRISVYSSLRNRIRTIVRYETSRCLYVVQEKVINEMWETDLMIVLRGVVNKTIVRTDMCSNIVEKLWRTVFNSKRKGLRDLGVEDRRKEGPQLHLDFELSEIEIGDLDKKRRKRMYAAIALDYFSNVLVGVIFHQSGGIPTMQIDPRKLGVMAGKVVSTVGYKRSVSGYVRDAFGDLQRSEFVVDFGGHRIMFLVVSVEVVKTLRDLSKKQIYAMPSSLRIDTKKRKRLNAKEKEKKKFLREESLLNAAAYVSSFIEVVFEDELLKAHTTAHIDRLSKETLRVATTHQIRLTCTKKYVERLAEKVSDHVFTEISMGVLLEIVNEISRRDIARLIRGVAYSMLNDVVCQEVDIQTTHATLNEAIEYDVVYGIFSCSFERECLSIELYRDIFLDIFKEQCLETLLSAQAAKLFDEIQLQKRMLEVAFPSPEAFTSRSLVNRYWLQAMAHQIAKSLVNGEIVTEMQLTLAYKQTMEQEVRKKQEHQLIQDSIEKIVRTHGKQVWVEETTKALARIHQQILIETITEYYYLLTEVMHELAGLAMDKALVHFILYVRPVLEMIQQEVERERKKYKTRFGNLVAGVATNFLETELYYLMKNCAYQAAVGPDPAVKPTPIVPDLAYLLAFDSLNITDVVSQHPIPPTTLACRKRVMRVCFDFRPEAIRRQKARSLFMKRAEERANFCWGKLHRHFIQHKFLKADPKDNGFDIFVMNTMSQAAIRIMREHKFEILQERYLPLFIKHVSMFIYGELIVTCGNNESFENLKKQYPGKELAHLFRRNWDRAVLEEGDVYLDFVNWVRGFNKPIQKERFPESQVVKRMKNPAAGRQRLAGGLKDVHASPRTEPTSNGNESSAGRSGSCRRVLRSPTDSTRSGAFAREEIDGEMRLRLEAIRGEYNSIEMTKQDMELPFVRKLVKKLPKMVAYRPGRKIPLEEASSSCEDSESCKGESDSSSGSSSLSGSSSSGLEESSEESEKDEDVSTKSSISGLDGVTQNHELTNGLKSFFAITTIKRKPTRQTSGSSEEGLSKRKFPRRPLLVDPVPLDPAPTSPTSCSSAPL